MNNKLLVFGPTGNVGIPLLRRALKEENLQITVFLRTPSKLPDDIRDRIRIVKGNALNVDDVNMAMEGHDAVISCLGPKLITDSADNYKVYYKGTENIIEAMRLHKVKYFSNVGFAPSLPESAWGSVICTCFSYVRAGHAMASYIRGVEDITWTSVMPFLIGGGDFTGNYKLELNKVPGFCQNTVNVGDLADWLVKTTIDQSKMEECRHKMYGIVSGSCCTIL